MKKRYIVLLFVVFLFLIIVCITYYMKFSVNKSKTKEIVSNKVQEIDNMEDNSMETAFFKFDLQIVAEHPADVVNALDMLAADDTIYVLVSIYNEQENMSYKLVSFDFCGNYMDAIPLEMPKTNETIILEQFTIGQDGKVYAFWINYEQMSGEINTPRYDAHTQLVSWSQEGVICSVLSIEALDVKFYESVSIHQMMVSKESDISLYCTEGVSNSRLIVQLNADGQIQKIVEKEIENYIIGNSHVILENSGIFSFIRRENIGLPSVYNDKYKLYYLTYDTEIHQISEEMELPMEIWNSEKIYADKKDGLLLLKDGIFYRFAFSSENIEPIFETKQYGWGYIDEIMAIEDRKFLIRYIVEGTETVFAVAIVYLS